MGQEFTIKSEAIEDKINQLLPTQGGFQPGIDFSASTMIIPIVDLTETASGSALREDLQKSFSHTSITTFSVNNTTTVIQNVAGYYRVFGSFTGQPASGLGKEGNIEINDGSTVKKVYTCRLPATTNLTAVQQLFDIILFIKPGDSIQVTADNTVIMGGSSRQIADSSGNLVNPV